MDLNEFLRNIKTAAKDDTSRVPPLLSGKKRSSEAKDLPSPVSSRALDAGDKRIRRIGAAEGLNIQAAQEALAQERGDISAQAQQQRAQAGLLSEQAAARMAHQVLEYVIQEELGGRHNAAKGGAAPGVPPAAQLAAEKAMWTPAAGYVIHHILPASLDTSTHTLESLMSVMEKDRVPDGVRALRATLQVCDAERDLVGGVRAGMAPHLRAHVLEVLEKGLRGQAWLRDDTAVATQMSALSRSTTPEKKPSSIVLFSRLGTPSEAKANAADSACGVPVSLGNASKQKSIDFALEDFLGTAESASSSSEEEGL